LDEAPVEGIMLGTAPVGDLHPGLDAVLAPAQALGHDRFLEGASAHRHRRAHLVAHVSGDPRGGTAQDRLGLARSEVLELLPHEPDSMEDGADGHAYTRQLSSMRSAITLRATESPSTELSRSR